MPGISDLDRVSMIVLRSMRPPIFVLLLVYAIGITGMALIPGYDENGAPARMSLFHSFYFFTYTATTTGFGEIPAAFSDKQRLWATFCLYMGVVAWLYAIGSVIRLLQNKHFISALNEYRFTRKVKRIADPYYIVCGFGDTGSLLVRGLDENYLRAVVLDNDEERIKALKLRDYHDEVPGLCADVAIPKHLIHAGIQSRQCVAVVALTENEQTNLKVAVMARFLNAKLRVLCRTSSPRIQQHLSKLDGVTVINPFEIFAERLAAAIVAPQLINLSHWLAGASDRALGDIKNIPDGHWIVCGFGRMGRWLHHSLGDLDIRMTIIDPHAEGVDGVNRKYADYDILESAGIAEADCVVAGTNTDSENLSILLSARTLNPSVYTIVRQNWHENQLAFDAASADLIMQSSLITARTVLTQCISPLIGRLEQHLRNEGVQATLELVNRIETTLSGDSPHLFRVWLTPQLTEALVELLDAGQLVVLSDILADPHNREQRIRCIPLLLQRAGSHHLLPAENYKLHTGDDILFCGTRNSESTLFATLNNPYTLHYCLTGDDKPSSYVFSWIADRMRATA